MKRFKYILSILFGLSAMLTLTGCQKELSGDGFAVLTEDTYLTFEAQEAEAQIVHLKADGKWTAEVSVEWLTVSPMSGDGHTDVTVTVADNLKNGAVDEPREGTIRFIASDGRQYGGYLSYAKCSVSVTQKGDKYLSVKKETTVTETSELWDTESAKVKGAQVVAAVEGGFVISDGTTNMYVESGEKVNVGDMISLNGTKVTVDGLPSFLGDEVKILSNSSVSYPDASDITSNLNDFSSEKVELVKVKGTLIGNQLLGIEGDPVKGVNLYLAPGMDKFAVHALDITGYWLGVKDAHTIAVVSFEDNGENLDICAPFPFRENFSWLAPFVEEAKTKVAEKKWPIDAVGANVNTGTNLPNLYTEIPSCLAEFKKRGYSDYMPEYESIFLADGYLKFSISKKPTGIVLPLLAIEGEQDIYVQFNWCAEKNGSGVIDGVNMVVEIDGPGKFENPSSDNPQMCQKIATTQVADQLAWQYASVRINGATMSTRISIHPNETSGMRRYFIDNINVVSLADAVPANIQIEEGPQDNIFKFEGVPDGPQTFYITSDKEFFVTSSANWIKLDVLSGMPYEKTKISVTCDETTLSNMREAYITITSGSTTQKLIVIQSAAGVELSPFISIVGGNSLGISEESEDINLEIQSNVAFESEVIEGAEWLSVVEVPATKALVEFTPVTLKAEANQNPVERVGKVRFFNENEGIEAIYTVTQKKRLAFVDLAIWSLNADTYNSYASTFNTTGRVEGFGGSYAAPTFGKGSITFYQVDKTSFDVEDKNVTRNVNESDYDFLAKGIWIGDYWLFKASREDDSVIPSGSQFEIMFSTRISSAGPALWIAEFYDGKTWKPAAETKTKEVNGSTVTYNVEHEGTAVYNHEFLLTSSSDMSEFQFRLRCVATLRPNGNVDAKPSGGNLRIKGVDLSPRIRVLYSK